MQPLNEVSRRINDRDKNNRILIACICVYIKKRFMVRKKNAPGLFKIIEHGWGTEIVKYI